MYVLHTYLAYLAISLPVTVWVARTLHRNGRAFLVEAFHGQEELADSINHLLVVGFYLINVGWIVMTLRTRYDLDTARAAVELLSDKVGTVLFVLGLMHFFNLYIFSRFRRRALDRGLPPIAPNGFFAPREEAR
jgi:energy-converting hydrogenase Eha subunit C